MMRQEGCQKTAGDHHQHQARPGVKWTMIWFTLFSLIGLGGLAWWCQGAPIRLNLSPSMPLGWYWPVSTRQYHRGDIVAVCLPTPIAMVGLQRGYLTRGQCPDGIVPVLKQLIAVPGDTITVTPLMITVNGQGYLAPQFKHDPQGHHIRQFIQDKRYTDVKHYWLYGSHDYIQSWDSRYYGGVPRAAIIGVYRSLLTVGS